MSRRPAWVLAVIATALAGVLIGLFALNAGDGPLLGGDDATEAAASSGAAAGGRDDEGDPAKSGTANVTKEGSAKSEVQIHTEKAGDTNFPGLPKPEDKASKNAPLILGSLPEEGGASGGLVKGFPRDIVTLPDGATVITSSVAPAKDSYQVALTARVGGTADNVFAHYRKTWTPKGWSESSVRAAGGAEATSFTRGKDSFVVTVETPQKKAVVFTVFGSLHR